MIRSEVGELAISEPRDVPFEIKMLGDMSDEQMCYYYDVVIAQFGDHYLHQGALMNRGQRIPMVGILHDATIPNLVINWAVDEAKNDDLAIRRIAELGAELYGHDATREIHWTDPLSYATEFPMLELVSGYLDGAVVHAGHYRDRVAATTQGPVQIIPLVADDLLLPEMPTARPGCITVGVIGNVNPNKRIDQLLIAVGASHQLRKSVQVKIVGHVEPEPARHLRAMAEALGIAPPIFTGWVEDEQMSAELADIDVVCCLRFPVLEGASASLVLALRSGRPTLVSRHGSYAETPDNMALFCEPGNEAREVLLHLESLLADPEHGQEMGARAKDWATRRHSVESYVDQLETFLYEYSRLRPILDARRAMTDIFSQVGLNRDDPAVIRGHAALAQIVG
ncbi:MAG: glycosyltransferase family 4 protein [Sphingomonas bacterium]|nr:glycosyltransferase family 4 protein [Sphingomonas bacterium]